MGMTEQEAIEILEKPSVHIKTVHRTENGMDFLTYSANLVEAFEMSIKALEKQIAKKPKEIDEDLNTFVCPLCNKRLFTLDNITTHKYCLICGQKLDWGNEDAE